MTTKWETLYLKAYEKQGLHGKLLGGNKYTDSDNRLEIILLDSLVGSVLMCGLRIIPLNHSHITEIQSFYSGCIRSLIQGRYADLGRKHLINYNIREIHNIPTIEGRLLYQRLRMYINWKIPCR